MFSFQKIHACLNITGTVIVQCALFSFLVLLGIFSVDFSTRWPHTLKWRAPVTERPILHASRRYWHGGSWNVETFDPRLWFGVNAAVIYTLLDISPVRLLNIAFGRGQWANSLSLRLLVLWKSRHTNGVRQTCLENTLGTGARLLPCGEGAWVQLTWCRGPEALQIIA